MTKQPIRVRCSGKARRDGVENGRTSQPWARVSRGLSCTHVHEVLTPMATVVHQALPFGHDPEGKVALTPDPAFDGETVLRRRLSLLARGWTSRCSLLPAVQPAEELRGRGIRVTIRFPSPAPGNSAATAVKTAVYEAILAGR